MASQYNYQYYQDLLKQYQAAHPDPNAEADKGKWIPVTGWGTSRDGGYYLDPGQYGGVAAEVGGYSDPTSIAALAGQGAYLGQSMSDWQKTLTPAQMLDYQRADQDWQSQQNKSGWTNAGLASLALVGGPLAYLGATGGLGAGAAAGAADAGATGAAELGAPIAYSDAAGNT